MDGTLALIFAIASLTDMAWNHCDDGCLNLQSSQSRLSIQGAALIFQQEEIGKEVFVGYDLGHTYGPYQLTIGASLTDTGDGWVGAGAKWRSDSISTGPIFVEASLMPGLYLHGDGPNIGGPLQFRSALSVGYEFENGSTLTMSYDHRSNADRLPFNPGLETLSLRYSFAFD
jgi:hypothetical protein